MKLLACTLIALVSGIELTPDNWEENTRGKTVFIKFFAPWCGHCKAMKPDWDRLMEEFKDDPTGLVAEVDCTAEGQELCSMAGVEGYPTLKYGDPNNLQDYEGGREYDDFLDFAKENLGPICGITTMENCDEDKKAKLEAFLAQGLEKLEVRMTEINDGISALEEDFDKEVEKLQDRYEKLVEEKENTTKELKGQDFGLLNSVVAHLKSGSSDEHDEL